MAKDAGTLSCHSRRTESASHRTRFGPSGITLIELLVAMAIVALMTAIAYPSLTAGLDGIRLQTSVDRAGTFFSQARIACDRHQQPVQVTIDPKKNQLTGLAVAGGWKDSFSLTDGVRVAFPRQRRSYLFYPGAPAPELRLLLESESGGQAGLKINVFTSVPEAWAGEGIRER